MELQGYTHMMTVLQEEVVKQKKDISSFNGREVALYGRYPKVGEKLLVKKTGVIKSIDCEKDMKDRNNFGYFQNTMLVVETDKGEDRFPASMVFIKNIS